MQVTVIRHIPPMQVGSCGIVHHHAFEQFEDELDALEATGVFVERIASAQESGGLPRVSINGDLLCEGRYPTRHEWAHALGEARRSEHVAEVLVVGL